MLIFVGKRKFHAPQPINMGCFDNWVSVLMNAEREFLHHIASSQCPNPLKDTPLSDLLPAMAADGNCSFRQISTRGAFQESPPDHLSGLFGQFKASIICFHEARIRMKAKHSIFYIFKVFEGVFF